MISGASANVIYPATIWVIPAFIAITFHKALGSLRIFSETTLPYD